ncbi:MAG: universal stress protein [Alphaproteobacteria bacterium]
MSKTNFLVLVDNSDEMTVALKFACLRANATGGHVTLAYIIEPSSGGENWLAISEIAKQEAEEEAKETIQKYVEQVQRHTGETPKIIMREGNVAEEFAKLISEEKSISIAVLAACATDANPGPVISYLMGKGIGSFHVPITIVPGSITDDELEAIA